MIYDLFYSHNVAHRSVGHFFACPALALKDYDSLSDALPRQYSVLLKNCNKYCF